MNMLKKRPRVRQKLPTECWACGYGGGYVKKEFNYECQKCGHKIISNEQMDSVIQNSKLSQNKT